MDSREKAFLDDMVQITCMNHIMTVYILQKTLNPIESEISNLEDVAKYALHALRYHPDPDALLEDIRKNNEAKRVETIIAAKIFAELIAALEDLGALGDAIRYRNKGIFYRYLNSKTGQAASFFDWVLKNDKQTFPNTGLDVLLGLPSVASLQDQITEEVAGQLMQNYQILSQNLRIAAEIYQQQTSQVKPAILTKTVSSNPQEDVNILLDILQLNQPPNVLSQTGITSNKSGIHVRAFNKLKHRFMVTDNLTSYAGSRGSDYVEYCHFPLNSEFVQTLVDNTVAVAGTMEKLAPSFCNLIQQVSSFDSIQVILTSPLGRYPQRSF